MDSGGIFSLDSGGATANDFAYCRELFSDFSDMLVFVVRIDVETRKLENV